jgi:NADH-quinone oxidoreductase subunit N
MYTLITISIVAIIVLYLGLYKAKNLLLPVTLSGLAVSVVFAAFDWGKEAQPIYSGMMLFDSFSIAFSILCIVSTMLILIISREYFEKISEHVAEYYAIILFALAGIVVMVSFNNLTMLFIGIEIMSVSLYILAGIRKNDVGSNESALKYFLMGAFSTGFLLFGITLIYGVTASFDLGNIKEYVIANPMNISPLLYGGIILLIIGLCFKIGAAPFHFWTPDVYEGAPILITSFMSTVVKTAAFAAFLRLFLMAFESLHDFWMQPLLIITILTLVVGNVTAVFQTNFKRMLAYSSISHAGYLLFAIVSLSNSSINAVFVYTAAYSIATISAFAVLILVKRQTGSENFDAFNGLYKTNPFLAFALTVSMLSLAGIPLTAGFIGKFLMFSNALSEYHIWLVTIAVINAVVGVFYYLRVVVSMYFKDAERTLILPSTYFRFVLGVAVLATINLD